MPGFFHRGPRRVWASLNVNTGARDPVDLSVGAGPAGETYLNRLLTHQLPDRAATYCLQMCGLLTDEERAARERHGSSWTTRHDMIVSCLLRLSGSSTRSWRSDAQPPPTRARAGHLAIDSTGP